DGSTLYDWASLFGLALPAEIGLDLSNAAPVAGALLTAISGVFRQILRAAKAGNNPNVRIVALCGDAFFDALIAHPDVRVTYLNWQAAADLRVTRPFQTFTFGGIDWVNYRGSDDNSTIAIN